MDRQSCGYCGSFSVEMTVPPLAGRARRHHHVDGLRLDREALDAPGHAVSTEERTLLYSAHTTPHTALHLNKSREALRQRKFDAHLDAQPHHRVRAPLLLAVDAGQLDAADGVLKQVKAVQTGAQLL